jgi:hypothetical protein
MPAWGGRASPVGNQAADVAGNAPGDARRDKFLFCFFFVKIFFLVSIFKLAFSV